MQKGILLEHPGLILQEEFLIPLHLSAYQVAKGTGLTQQALGLILKGKRAITAATSLRLDAYFSLSEGYFFRLQEDYELRLARQEVGPRLLNEVTPLRRL